MTLTKNEILDLNYPDFVAFLEQENTPPGADYTLKYWVQEGQINSKSHVFDLACTTGFSLRRASQLTGCSGFGLDISKTAIDQASIFAAKEELSSIGFVHGDATDIPFKDQFFTHILGGSNFSFIQAREKGLVEVARVLKPAGFLCVSNYFYNKPPTVQTLDSVEKAIGFRPSAEWTEAYWNEFLSTHFALFKSDQFQLPVNTDDEIRTSIQNQLNRNSKKLGSAELKVCADRLFEIRKVLNEHRRYQTIALQIWIKK
jgi:SAM-dependent methyltransferase